MKKKLNKSIILKLQIQSKIIRSILIIRIQLKRKTRKAKGQDEQKERI